MHYIYHSDVLCIKANAKVREKSMLWLYLPISYFSYRYTSLIYELLQSMDEGW